MKTRSLTLSIVLVSGMAATAAMAAYGTSTPAALTMGDRPVQARTPEIRTPAPGSPTGNRVVEPNAPVENCHQAVWPYIPVHCMKNVDPERLRRPVRIIRIDAAVPKLGISVR